MRTGRTTEIMYTGNGSAYLRFNQYQDTSCTYLEAYTIRELTGDVDVMKLAAAWHLRGEMPPDEDEAYRQALIKISEDAKKSITQSQEGKE